MEPGSICLQAMWRIGRTAPKIATLPQTQAAQQLAGSLLHIPVHKEIA